MKMMLPPALVAGFLLIGPLAAQETHHHEGKSPAVDRFYSTWMRPDKPSMSCCSLIDCDEAEARQVDGVWYAKRKRDASWLKVPADRVEYNRDSPDGRNHLCASNPGVLNYTAEVYCFVVGSGS